MNQEEATMTPTPQKRHRHEWGYVETVTETVEREVWHRSPVGGLCIHCQKLRHPSQRKQVRA